MLGHLTSLATLPLRLATKTAVLLIREGVSLAERLVEHPSPAAEPVGPREPAARPAAPRPAPPPPAPPPAPPAQEAPDPADLPGAPEPHISDEPVLVAEVADPGAEDGAGPEITIREPFPGYRRMKVGEIVTQLRSASAEEVAVVQLYEGMQKRRKSVLAAAESRLKLLNDPATR